MSNHPERIIQFNIVNWLRQKHPEIVFHANIAEQKATLAWRDIQTRMGFRKGVSDLFFPGGNDYYHGLWLELKTTIGKASNSQLDFLRDMVKLGYAGSIAYGYEEAKSIIKEFYQLID